MANTEGRSLGKELVFWAGRNHSCSIVGIVVDCVTGCHQSLIGIVLYLTGRRMVSRLPGLRQMDGSTFVRISTD